MPVTAPDAGKHRVLSLFLQIDAPVLPDSEMVVFAAGQSGMRAAAAETGGGGLSGAENKDACHSARCRKASGAFVIFSD